MGVLVLDERLTWYQPVGALIVLLGVAVAQGVPGRLLTRFRSRQSHMEERSPNTLLQPTPQPTMREDTLFRSSTATRSASPATIARTWAGWHGAGVVPRTSSAELVEYTAHVLKRVAVVEMVPIRPWVRGVRGVGRYLACGFGDKGSGREGTEVVDCLEVGKHVCCGGEVVDRRHHVDEVNAHDACGDEVVGFEQVVDIGAKNLECL